ncbi:MAG: fimbrillin family protein, partial [Bacteroidales bacterium]|nr:fimbrillin family protein [Bacteroidales bacterium]
MAVLTGLALFASCSQDDDLSDQTSPEQVGEISFNIGFAAPKTRVTTDHLFNSTWQAGDEIGLFAVTRAAGATNALKPT